MKNNNLLERVGALGFSLFSVEEDQDANSTLADVVNLGDLRLWEGFPVMLANCGEKGLFDYEKVGLYLKKHSGKVCLSSLMIMSLAVYKFFDLKFSWADKFYKSLSGAGRKEFTALSDKLKKDSDFNVAGRGMSASRVKSVFNNYFSQTKTKLNEMLQMKDEMNLEYSLSQVFSPKQKELFLKKLRREKLTKTEKEYYSRVVKKKVLALANPELHNLSQKILD